MQEVIRLMTTHHVLVMRIHILIQGVEGEALEVPDTIILIKTIPGKGPIKQQRMKNQNHL